MSSTHGYREETFFPAEFNRPDSSASMTASERMGAFGEMSHRNLIQQPRPGVSRPHQETPILTDNSQYSANTSTSNQYVPLIRPYPGPSRQQFPNNSNYHPHESRSSSRSNLTAPRIAEVVRFNNNQNDVNITQELSIIVLFFLTIIAFFMIVMGVLNLPYCPLEPMIPVWLIIAGILFIISATYRIYFLIPTPRKSPYSRHQRRLGGSILCKGFELLFALANLIWLILGCVWVYGRHSFLRFELGMYERDYCEPSVYWSAIAACSSFLVFFTLLIVLILCLLVVGSWKDAARETQELP